MDALGFDGYMGKSDPEYSDSELKSSRSQWWLAMNCVRLHSASIDTAEIQSHTGWRVVHGWPVAQRH